MNGAEIGLVLSVFLACAVEAVEALTIVLAVGAARSWPSALGGVAAAIIALAAIVLALGAAITSLPIDALRLVVGGLLLIFGLQWLGKATLRSAGVKAKHDELQTYEQETETARAAGGNDGFDGYSFAISFKGVLLEGLEVAFIVLTFGANQHRVGLAAAAAGIAVLAVVVAGLAVRAPLARVPENTLKLAVGVMLSSFGTFWGAQGAGAHWPGGEAALVAIVSGILVGSVAIAATVRRPTVSGIGHPASIARVTLPETRLAKIEVRKRVGRPLLAVWEFVVGEDWRTAIGVGAALALTALMADDGVAAWWVMPGAALGLLALSTRRAAHEAPRRRGAQGVTGAPQ